MTKNQNNVLRKFAMRMLNICFIFCILISGISCSHKIVNSEQMPSATEKSDFTPEIKRQMVLDLKNEIERLDGDGLLPRSKKSVSWNETIHRLSEDAANSHIPFQLGRVFKRIDATYTNLHSKVYLSTEYDEKKAEGAVSFPFMIAAEFIKPNQKTAKYFINKKLNSNDQLQNGDEVLSINQKSISDWLEENFIFCKFPLKEQCDIEFFDNFRNELLSWNRHNPLFFEIRRKSKKLSVSILPEIKQNMVENEQKNNKFPCDVTPTRYQGFHLVYEGQNLCAFESNINKNVVALRIKSFQYQDVPFAVLDGEVQIFWQNYWRTKAKTVSNLIIDVIDNVGGQSPIPYYALFYHKPYQEQFVQFKKINEFERKDIFESLLWGDKGKEIWFENMKHEGVFSKSTENQFLSPIPQFCSSPKKDCREGLFLPIENNFKGEVKLLMNHWCISSCVGFVYNIKDLLKQRVTTYGIPDSGDSTYSRLTLAINNIPNNNYEIKVAPLKKAKNPDDSVSFVRQVVSVTRSTDKDGNLLSGNPQHIDHWVPRKWNQSDDEWASEVFKKAISDTKTEVTK